MFVVEFKQRLKQNKISLLNNVFVESLMKLLEQVKESIARMVVRNEVELVKIKSITPKAVEPVYNFTTTTHTYLLDKGVIVHNCDTISMLTMMDTWRPSAVADLKYNDESGIWEDRIEDNSDSLGSYIV